jgi:hypothetical protein
VFVRIGWESLSGVKLSTLLQILANYGLKKLYNIGPTGSQVSRADGLLVQDVGDVASHLVKIS